VRWRHGDGVEERRRRRIHAAVERRRRRWKHRGRKHD
jgi:hypothetical protein